MQIWTWLLAKPASIFIAAAILVATTSVAAVIYLCEFWLPIGGISLAVRICVIDLVLLVGLFLGTFLGLLAWFKIKYEPQE